MIERQIRDIIQFHKKLALIAIGDSIGIKRSEHFKPTKGKSKLITYGMGKNQKLITQGL